VEARLFRDLLYIFPRGKLTAAAPYGRLIYAGEEMKKKREKVCRRKMKREEELLARTKRIKSG